MFWTDDVTASVNEVGAGGTGVSDGED